MTTGNVIMDSGHSYNGGGLQTSFDLACPKDASPAPVTIQITAIADTFNPNPNAQPVTLIDTLTVMVKGVDVRSFTIADDNNQSAATTPLWFGPTTAGAPDLDGTAFSIEFSNGTIPGKRTGLHSGIGMYAKVTNNTAYDLDIGFVQVISFNTSSRYTDGITGQAKVGNNVLDIDKTNTNFMYQLPDRVPSGATRNLPLGGIGGKDLPVMQSPMRIAYTFSTAYLSSMQYNLQAQTSPTLYGGTMPQGTMPNPGPPVSGYPIALSTASWQFNGTATNGPNTSNPGAADITSTQTPGNWSTSLGTSAGAYPAVRPGPNLGWTATGDGLSKYLQWNGNGRDILGNDSGTTLSSGSSGGPPRRPSTRLPSTRPGFLMYDSRSAAVAPDVDGVQILGPIVATAQDLVSTSLPTARELFARKPHRSFTF